MTTPVFPAATAVIEIADDNRRYCTRPDLPGGSESDPNIPNASAVLLVDDRNSGDVIGTVNSEHYIGASNPSHTGINGINTTEVLSPQYYANAEIVGSSPDDNSERFRFGRRFTTAIPEATPLDPWSKTQTTASSLHTPVSRSETARLHSNTTISDNVNDIVVVTEPERNEHHPHQNRREEMLRYRLLAAMREDPFQKKHRRRRRRRARMMAGGMTGFVFGTFILGPIGSVAGAAAGVIVARTASKIGEKRKDVRVQRERERLDTEQDRQLSNPPTFNTDESEQNYWNPTPVQEAYAIADDIQNDRGRARRSGRFRHSRSSRTR